jgi:hypothetical protein
MKSQIGGQHDAHLVFGERGAQATPYATSEGNPAVGPGSLLKKAFRPELPRVRVDVGPPVQQVDRRHHTHPGRQPDSADLDRGFEAPGN